MPEKSARTRKWRAGALGAGRAAAFLTLATGINGTIAAYLPQYEPFYVYLISVVIVAWLGGALLGITTAVAAAICYDWLFSPLPTGIAVSSVVPMSVAVAAAVLTQLARAPIPRKHLAVAPAPALLAGEVTAVAEVADTRLTDLERRLAEARADVDSALAAADGETRLRLDEASRNAAREAGLRDELETMRAAAADQSTRVASLRRDVEAAKQRNLDLDGRLAAIQQELEVAYRKVDEERTRAERETTLRGQLETAARQTLQKTADVAASHQLTASKSQARAAELEQELATLRSSTPLLEAELDRVRKILDDETERADRETELREQLETAGHEKLQQAVNDLSVKYEGALSTANEQRRALTAERDELRASIANLQNMAADLTSRHQATLLAAKDRDAIENELRDLQRTVERMTQEAESGRREREGLREAASVLRSDLESTRRAQAEANTEHAAERQRMLAESHQALGLTKLKAGELQNTVATLMYDLEFARKALTDANAVHAAERDRLQREIERDASEKAVSLQTTVTALMRDLESARKALTDANEEHAAERQNLLAEHDQRLDHIVAGLTGDYEQTIGEAVVDKESARAEVRMLNAKLEEVQRDTSKLQREVERRTAELEAAVEREKQRADGEKAAREALDLEWSGKLQKIVEGLASDHESDLGNAMVEKEEAKAEARSLSKRFEALQQRMNEDREQFRHLAEKWQAERTALLNRPTAVAETAPLFRGPVVLVVHSDPGVRSMTKHALEQSGYSVLTAVDGLEGLRVAGSQKPAAIIAEAVMPKMNGRELVQLLKSRPDTAEMKIVLMNGAQGGPKENASDFRADDFLSNPNDFAAMRATLANLLPR